jgi:hypothetical protein
VKAQAAGDDTLNDAIDNTVYELNSDLLSTLAPGLKHPGRPHLPNMQPDHTFMNAVRNGTMPAADMITTSQVDRMIEQQARPGGFEFTAQYPLLLATFAATGFGISRFSARVAAQCSYPALQGVRSQYTPPINLNLDPFDLD